MENPIVIWYVIVGAVLLAFLVRFVCYISRQTGDKSRHKFFGCCKEWELFYIPGDRTDYDDSDYEDD